MATFKVEEFCDSDFGHSELRKLKEEDLVAVAEYFQIDINPETKKLAMVEALIKELRLHDPIQERETEQERQLELTREKAKAEERDRMLQLEFAKVRAWEQEQKLKLAKIALEQEKLTANNNALQRKHEARFDISSCLRLMPKFNRDDVGSFFEAFEKIAMELDWPQDKWKFLVQSAGTKTHNFQDLRQLI